MEVIRTIHEMRQTVKQLKMQGKRIGIVPTMGYLHDGHRSLMQAAKKQTDITVLSIFVNPIQFGPGEDYETYPRDEERDLQIAENEGVDYVFVPSVQEMYPQPTRTKVQVAGVTEKLCGASRPGHFDGVSTVVSKLFHIVAPDQAFFGLKDGQQVAVIQQMVNDLNIDVQVIPCPTVREPDGLALSSRNKYLSPEERKQAVILSQSLSKLQEWLKGSNLTAEQLRGKLAEFIAAAPLANIDYVQILTYPELEEPAPDQPLSKLPGRYIAALAVKFGQTRLIDNTIFTIS